MTLIALGMLAGSPTGALAAGQNPDDDARDHEQVTNMENALKVAVSKGARELSTQLRNALPLANQIRDVNTALLGSPEVLGLRVRPHGMVFVVRVPQMNANFTWLVTQASPRNPAAPSSRLATPPGQGQQAPRVFAAAVPGDPATPGPAVETARPLTQAEAEVLADPWAAYRRFVKEALMDTMLTYGDTLRIPAGQYLTVATRRDTPPNPLDPSDLVRTTTFTVSSATLEAYHQKRMTLEEARKAITVDED
jgi:hypothetical protein